MSLLAAHLNDAEIVVVNDKAILYREPGFVLLEDDHLVVGSEAYSSARLAPRRIQNRYWTDLSTGSLPDRRFQQLSSADLVSRQLEAIWQTVSKPGDQLVLAIPPSMKTESLGLLLGILNELGIPVVGMYDAAVCATRRHYEHAVPVHIDLGLHAATLTRLQQEGQAQVDRAAVIEDNGLLVLYEAWLKVIAEIFVQQSRFDPLHTAETEQMLQDRLPAWLAAASGAETVQLSVEYQGVTHSAELEALELVAAAGPFYQSIVSSLRALIKAEETPAIQLTSRAAATPGLADTLKSRVGGEVFLLESGATALGLVKRASPESASGGISLLRHLPWDQVPQSVESRTDQAGSSRPTHLLYGNTAYSIHEQPLVLGSRSDDNERRLDFHEEMPGVSRRHCVIAAANGQCVVTDHSRYGTFLNGHRIEGSAVLQSGDLIRIGTPGFELRLITAEAPGGA